MEFKFGDRVSYTQHGVTSSPMVYLREGPLKGEALVADSYGTQTIVTASNLTKINEKPAPPEGYEHIDGVPPHVGTKRYVFWHAFSGKWKDVSSWDGSKETFFGFAGVLMARLIPIPDPLISESYVSDDGIGVFELDGNLQSVKLPQFKGKTAKLTIEVVK